MPETGFGFRHQLEVSDFAESFAQSASSSLRA